MAVFYFTIAFSTVQDVPILRVVGLPGPSEPAGPSPGLVGPSDPAGPGLAQLAQALGRAGRQGFGWACQAPQWSEEPDYLDKSDRVNVDVSNFSYRVFLEC